MSIVNKWFQTLCENAVTVNGVVLNTGTTATRTAISLTLTTANKGKYLFFDETESRPYWWSGTEWV
jgi:hypothetical protein